VDSFCAAALPKNFGEDGVTELFGVDPHGKGPEAWKKGRGIEKFVQMDHGLMIDLDV
jgi:hypothetical protein